MRNDISSPKPGGATNNLPPLSWGRWCLLLGLLLALSTPRAAWAQDFPPEGIPILERDASGWFLVDEKAKNSGIYLPWLDEEGEKRTLPTCGEVLLSIPEPSPVFDLWAFWREDPTLLYRVGSGLPLVPRPCSGSGKPFGQHLVLLFAHGGQVYDLHDLMIKSREPFLAAEIPPVILHFLDEVDRSWTDCPVTWMAGARWSHPDKDLLPQWSLPTAFEGPIGTPPPDIDLPAFSPFEAYLLQKVPLSQRDQRKKAQLREDIRNLRARVKKAESQLEDSNNDEQLVKILQNYISRRENRIIELEFELNPPTPNYRTIPALRENFLAGKKRYSFPRAREVYLQPKGPKGISWRLRNALRCDEETWRIADGPSQVLDLDLTGAGSGSFRFENNFPEATGRIAPNAVLWKIPNCLRLPGIKFIFRVQTLQQDQPLEPSEGSYGFFTWIGPKPLVPMTTGEWHVYGILPRTQKPLSIGLMTVTETGHLLEPSPEFEFYCQQP